MLSRRLIISFLQCSIRQSNFATIAGAPLPASGLIKSCKDNDNDKDNNNNNSHTTTSSSISENDYFSKYENKIKKKVGSAGFNSVKECTQRLKTEGVVPPPVTPKSSKRPPAPRFTKPPYIKPLSEILQVDLVHNLDGNTLTQIWNKHHSQSNKDVISGVITRDFYEKYKKRAKQFPTFILPLPRKEGFEFFYLEHSDQQSYLTPLLEFKTHGEFARPYLVMTYYDELVSKFDLVLMLGEITNSNMLNTDEARNLAYQIQLFYVNGNAGKLGLVEKFHKNVAQFDYQELIAEIDKFH